jgi:hypothetical protein
MHLRGYSFIHFLMQAADECLSCLPDIPVIMTLNDERGKRFYLVADKPKVKMYGDPVT